MNPLLQRIASTSERLPAPVGRSAAVHRVARLPGRAEAAGPEAPVEAPAYASTAALLDSAENERRRIAGELHDGLGQTLGVLSAGIADLQRRLGEDDLPGVRATVHLLAGKVRLASHELRQAVLDLRPPLLDDFGVVATLTWLLGEFRWLHRDSAVSSDITVAEADIPAGVKTPLYRIVQEALNNIARHCPGADVSLSLHLAGDTLCLCVADRGPGFALPMRPATPGGMGLAGMRERARLSGGAFRLDTAPGRGTAVFVSWPVADAGPSLTSTGNLP